MPSPTIKDVAKAAAVSVATVSYVINNGPRPVNEETKIRVLKAMLELHYQPNASARRLRRQHNHVIGVALAGLSGRPGVADLYFLDILRGISVMADQAGYDLMVFSNQQKLRSVDFFQTLAATHMIDGLVASGSSINVEGMALLNEFGLPAIIVGRQYSGPKLRRVIYDFELDAYRATRFLIEQGHRRIVLCLNNLALLGETQRLEGYKRALAEGGIAYQPEWVYAPEKVTIYPPYEIIRDYYLTQSPTAFLTAPYMEICTFLDQLQAPPNIVVATLDEESHLPHHLRICYAARLPKYEAGQKAVELILSHIREESNIPDEVMLSSQFSVY